MDYRGLPRDNQVRANRHQRADDHDPDHRHRGRMEMHRLYLNPFDEQVPRYPVTVPVGLSFPLSFPHWTIRYSAVILLIIHVKNFCEYRRNHE